MANDEAEHREAELAIAWVRRIHDGDATAEGELVEHYSRGLLFMLRRMTGGSDLADDLHQDTFQVVLERLRKKGLEDPARLAGFIRRTARNLFIADHRKKARRQDGALEEAAPPRDPSLDPQRRAERDEEADLVRRLIEDLEPPRDREVLYRFYLAEEDKAVICQDLDLSSLHFNRVLYRARKRFKKLLERSQRIGRPASDDADAARRPRAEDPPGGIITAAAAERKREG